MIKNIDEANDRINQLESELDKAHTLMPEAKESCKKLSESRYGIYSSNFEELHVWTFYCPTCQEWSQTSDDPKENNEIICMQCEEIHSVLRGL